MQRRALDLSVRLVVAVTFASIGDACSRPSTAEGDADQSARSGDSARSVQTARSRSSATQAVDFSPEERARFTRVEQMIQAHFAGVTVTSTGNSFTMRIRGTGSFGSSNEPLLIIDGASRSTSELSGLNPRDVVRIEVVKDAAAFYGVRGSNGVILVTTRRGS